jgi:hypothetical protein
MLENTFSNKIEVTVEQQTLINETINKLDKFDCNDCQLEPVSKIELIDIISKLNSNSSPGPDGIHNLMLKNIPGIFIELLVHTANSSMATSRLPKVGKHL